MLEGTIWWSRRPPRSHYNRHKNNVRHIHTSIVSRHLATRGNNKILHTPPPHISSSEEIFPASPVAPFPNSVQINHHSSNNTSTRSTPNHIHHHCAPSVTPTHTTRIISSTAHTYTHTLSPLNLWTDPTGVPELLSRWTEKPIGGLQAGKIGLPQ